MAVVCISLELLETNINQFGELASLVAQRMFPPVTRERGGPLLLRMLQLLRTTVFLRRVCVSDKVLPGRNLQRSIIREFAGSMSSDSSAPSHIPSVLGCEVRPVIALTRSRFSVVVAVVVVVVVVVAVMRWLAGGHFGTSVVVDCWHIECSTDGQTDTMRRRRRECVG
jgi:hypothetical protein